MNNIGDYTYLGPGTNVTMAEIGRYTSIGSDCAIGHGEHRTDWISTSRWPYERRVDFYKVLTSGGCSIGNDVWIGTQAIIRRGVKIGNGAVVGAGSFVNRDVPDFAIVAGSPARIIRYRFSEKERNIINDSHWWDYDMDEAAEIIKNLENVIDIDLSL